MGKGMKVYRWALEADDPSWRNEAGIAETIKDVREPLADGKGPYRIKLRGKHETFSNERGLPDTLDRLEDRLRSSEIGDFFVVEPDKGRTAWVRAVRKEEPDVDAPGGLTPSAAKLYEEIWGKFPNGLTYWGGFNCRSIAGTSSWSQHAWGNALDVHTATMGLGDDVARFCRTLKLAAETLWKVPNHFDHVHVTAAPKKAGTPPCA